MKNLKVEPNQLSGGFFVVETTADGHRIPRGWTYPTRQLAEKAVPFVAAGNPYPTSAELENKPGLPARFGLEPFLVH